MALSSPLVSLTRTRRPFSEIKVGDLVTVKLYGGFISGARVERIAPGTIFVVLCGLGHRPLGYETGARFPLDTESVIDW